MKTLLKNGTIFNVFTREQYPADVLIEDGIITAVEDHLEDEQAALYDCQNQLIVPGFIDGHIHIESSMLTPSEFARAALAKGTTGVVADPHEIVNVAGARGLDWMLQASQGLPLDFYIALPSCVPAAKEEESGAIMKAADLKPFYKKERVIALGEVMDAPAVISRDPDMMQKIEDAKEAGVVINGHIPSIGGKDLDAYIAAGISDDHECASLEEAQEKLRKGMHILIRQGTAARNLQALLGLFEEPWCHRCLLVTDDRHAADLMDEGHIDAIIREVNAFGKDPAIAIQMATINAARYYNLKGKGAIAPGYDADLLFVDSLESLHIQNVMKNGVFFDRLEFSAPNVDTQLEQSIRHTFHMDPVTEKEFHIPCQGRQQGLVMGILPDTLLTQKIETSLDFDRNNGIDPERDIVKLSVLERHHQTGHHFTGLVQGTHLQQGAIASSVSHDSHNLIVLGSNSRDMCIAANRVRELQGGYVVVKDGRILAELPLPVGGLINEGSASQVARLNQDLRKATHELGIPEQQEILMTLAFLALPVIPELKITPRGYCEVLTNTYRPVVTAV